MARNGQDLTDEDYGGYEHDDIHTIDNLSDDQRNALEELKFRESMTLETDDDVDEYLSYLGEPPEYNVRQKLEQINRDWGTSENANTEMDEQSKSSSSHHQHQQQHHENNSNSHENGVGGGSSGGGGGNGHRQIKVGFKEQLVDLVAPAPNYEPSDDTGLSPRRSPTSSPQHSSIDESDEEHIENKNEKNQHHDDYYSDESESTVEQHENDAKKVSYVDDDDTKYDSNHYVDNNESHPASTSTTDTGEKCLIERDGKYILVNKSELEADEIENSTSNKGGENSRPKSAPNARPGSAMPNKRASRPQTAKPGKERYSLESPYALSPEDKDKQKKIQDKKDKDKQKQEEEKKKKEQEKRKENEAAFEGWLSLKKAQQQAEREAREKEEAKKPSSKAGSEELKITMEDWLKMKQNHAKTEEQLRRAKLQEEQEYAVNHTEEERRKAFRDWKRRKAREKRQQEKLDRQRARITKLALRKSRRSRALAAAIEKASTYEYYGYRF